MIECPECSAQIPGVRIPTDPLATAEEMAELFRRSLNASLMPTVAEIAAETNAMKARYLTLVESGIA